MNEAPPTPPQVYTAARRRMVRPVLVATVLADIVAVTTGLDYANGGPRWELYVCAGAATTGVILLCAAAVLMFYRRR